MAHPLPASIPAALETIARQAPGRAALVTGDARVSYADLAKRVDSAAAGLRGLGVRPGDRVAACLPNSLDIVELFFATMRLGAIWVGVNARLAPGERARLVRDCGASVFLAEKLILAETPDDGLTPGTLRVAHDQGSALPWHDAVADDVVAAPWPVVDPYAPAAIAYTSGTTGDPKGVLHTQHGMLLAAIGFGGVTVGAGDRLGVCLPLTILNLMILGPLTACATGATCVLLVRTDAVGLADLIRRHELDEIRALVPTSLYDMTHRDDIPADALAGLRTVATGAADLPESLREAFEVKFGKPLCGSYGLTEAPTVVTYERPDEPHRPGSSGRPLPYLRVEIRDGERCLPSGAEGEICVGPTAAGEWAGIYRPTPGYWSRSDSPVRNGLLRTGDIGRLDADGHLYVTGRRGDVIVRGGSNVHAAEVERVLVSVDGVTDAAVIGVPDERLGEQIVAYVAAAPHLTVEQIQDACAEELARYKRPDAVIVLPELPRNAMGKVVKAELRHRGPVAG